MFDEAKAEQDKNEVQAILYMIEARMKSEPNSSEEWRTISSNLKRAAAIAFALFRNHSNLQP